MTNPINCSTDEPIALLTSSAIDFSTPSILIAISFSLFNPQAILDTLVIIGGNANHYSGQLKYFFVIGTLAASFIWFFGLAFVTHVFSRKVLNPKFWRLLEMISGTMMLFFAGIFLVELYQLSIRI